MRTLAELDAALAQAQTYIAALGSALAQAQADIAVLKGGATSPAPTPSGNPDLDPRWYTRMTDAEKKAFAAANPMDGIYPPADPSGGEVAMARARYGWTDKQNGVTPEASATGFAANAKIAKMSQAEYMASEYGKVSPELACYLNLTGRKGSDRGVTTVDDFVASNNMGRGGPSGPRG
jgi:hypothetical protein